MPSRAMCRSCRISGRTRPFGTVPRSAQTAKMNGVDPQAWLADVLSRVAAHPAHRLDELLQWNWRKKDKDAPALAA
jgi:hypothetical protein